SGRLVDGEASRSMLMAPIRRHQWPLPRRLAENGGRFSTRRSVERTDQGGVVLDEADPATGVVARLPLQVLVARFAPGFHLVREIVEDVVALVGAHGQHCVTLAVGLA